MGFNSGFEGLKNTQLINR